MRFQERDRRQGRFGNRVWRISARWSSDVARSDDRRPAPRAMDHRIRGQDRLRQGMKRIGGRANKSVQGAMMRWKERCKTRLEGPVQFGSRAQEDRAQDEPAYSVGMYLCVGQRQSCAPKTHRPETRFSGSRACRISSRSAINQVRRGIGFAAAARRAAPSPR
jgi:hypothetical protein